MEHRGRASSNSGGPTWAAVRHADAAGRERHGASRCLWVVAVAQVAACVLQAGRGLTGLAIPPRPAGGRCGYWFVAGDVVILLVVVFKLFAGNG